VKALKVQIELLPCASVCSSHNLESVAVCVREMETIDSGAVPPVHDLKRIQILKRS